MQPIIRTGESTKNNLRRPCAWASSLTYFTPLLGRCYPVPLRSSCLFPLSDRCQCLVRDVRRVKEDGTIYVSGISVAPLKKRETRQMAMSLIG